MTLIFNIRLHFFLQRRIHKGGARLVLIFVTHHASLGNWVDLREMVLTLLVFFTDFTIAKLFRLFVLPWRETSGWC